MKYAKSQGFDNYNLSIDTPVLQIPELETKFNTQIICNALIRVFNCINQARIVQQLHFWLYSEHGVVLRDARWIWKPIREWLEESLPDLTRWKLESAIQSLVDRGIVIREQLNKEHHGHNYSPKNRTYYYRLDYDRLSELIAQVIPQKQSSKTQQSDCLKNNKPIVNSQQSSLLNNQQTRQNNTQYQQDKNIYIREPASTKDSTREESQREDLDPLSSESTDRQNSSSVNSPDLEAIVPEVVAQDKTLRVTKEVDSNKNVLVRTRSLGRPQALDMSVVTRQYDRALGINPPAEQKVVQQRFTAQQRFRGLPEGDWLINGELDRDFHDWVVKIWMKGEKFKGMTVYEMRPVLFMHFKKDHDSLATYWEQYGAETKHRINNVVNYGLEIDEAEQRKLMHRSRAIIQGGQQNGLAINDHEVHQLNSHDLPQLNGHNSPDNSKGEEAVVPPRRLINIQLNSKNNSATPETPRQEQPEAPRDKDGLTENSAAYQVYRPEPVENLVDKQVLMAELAKLSNSKFVMPKREPEPQKQQIEVMSLSEINKVLGEDPILRKGWSPQLKKDERFYCILNENGEVMRVEDAF